MARPRSRDDFKVVIMCALKHEADAVEATFDEIYQRDVVFYRKHANDPNQRVLGRIGDHYVVLLRTPGMGKVDAAHVATSCQSSFGKIALALVVGVCGGVPQPAEDLQIFRGDVIVSTQIIQTDFGRQFHDSIERKGRTEEALPPPSPRLKMFLDRLQSARIKYELPERVDKVLAEMKTREWYEMPSTPDPDEDYAFRSDYRHIHRDASCEICSVAKYPDHESCTKSRDALCDELGCDEAGHLIRKRRDNGPSILFGSLSSGDQVMKSSSHRDDIAKRDGVLGFEMEGAGVWKVFDTVVVKSVCDYADSHKDKVWQSYAAARAAATAKAILSEWMVVDLVLADEAASSITTHSEIGRKILMWLAKPEFYTRSADHSARRQEDTGTWILDDPTYKTWRYGAGRNLHFRGMHGGGKSTLMSLVADNLVSSATESLLLFFERTQDQHIELRDILGSLVRQKADTATYLSEELVRSYKKQDFGAHRPGRTQLYGLLKTMLPEDGTWFLVVDALDECPRQLFPDLVSLLRNLQSDYPRVKIIASAREPLDYISDAFNDVDIIPIRAHASDLHKYIKWQVDRRIGLHMIREAGLMDELENTLIQKSRGMFLLTQLQLELLDAQSRTFRSTNRFRQVLRSLADNLDDTYAEMWRFIISQPGNVDSAVDTLAWICFAHRRMSRKELQYALAAASLNPNGITWGDLPSMKPILDSLLGLVGDRRSNYIDFVHLSAREFFSRFLTTKLPNSHNLMCHICLSYIRLEHIDIQAGERMTVPCLRNQDEVEDQLVQSPLLEYALDSWTYHATHADERFQRSDLPRLLSDTKLTSRITRIAVIQRLDWPFDLLPLPHSILPQHIAAHLGQVKLLIALIGSGMNINAQDDNGWTALRWAVFGNQIEAVQCLLENGASVEIPDRSSNSTLLWALGERGATDSSCIRRIETFGTFPRYHIGRIWYKNPIFPTLCPIQPRCSIDIIRLLIVWATNIDYQNLEGETALLRAAFNHQFDITMDLIRRGANVEQCDRRGRDALSRVFDFDFPDRSCRLESLSSCRPVSLHIGDYFSSMSISARTYATNVEQGLIALVNKNFTRQIRATDNESRLASLPGSTALSRRILDLGREIDSESNGGKQFNRIPSTFDVAPLEARGRIMLHVGHYWESDHSNMDVAALTSAEEISATSRRDFSAEIHREIVDCTADYTSTGSLTDEASSEAIVGPPTGRSLQRDFENREVSRRLATHSDLSPPPRWHEPHATTSIFPTRMSQPIQRTNFATNSYGELSAHDKAIMYDGDFGDDHAAFNRICAAMHDNPLGPLDAWGEMDIGDDCRVFRGNYYGDNFHNTPHHFQGVMDSMHASYQESRRNRHRQSAALEGSQVLPALADRSRHDSVRAVRGENGGDTSLLVPQGLSRRWRDTEASGEI